MYKKLGVAGVALGSSTAYAAEEVGGIDGMIRQIFEPIATVVNDVVFAKIGGTDIMFIVAWLALASLICTLYFGFIQFRKFKLSLDIVRGRYSDPSHPGEVTHFQALSTALSGTVGLGNIAGVAVAISIGGPGATVWMIIMGLMGMATKMVECTLGVKYRKINADGSVSGGPMYYLSAGLAEVGFPNIGKVLAFLAAVMVIFGSFGAGNMFQANQATAQLMTQFDIHSGAYLFGLAFAAATAVVIIGGIRTIAKVTEWLVPIMAVIYLGACVVILTMHFTQIPAAVMAIIEGAFSPAAGLGGIIGVMIQGFKRAAFSNEAGFGSAPIAHSAVKTAEPSTEGLVAMLEPFIDTVVICTMTALIVVVTGAYTHTELEGVKITALAFNTVLPGFDVVLTIAVVLFAYSTMISWSYYGLKGWTYLFGERSALLYKLIFCSFCVVGASMSLGPVLDLSDAGVFVMAFINVIGLYFLLPIVKREITGFLAKVKSGEIRPNE